MAVPTLTACTPSTVFTGGQLVTLTGTNFRLPYALPNTNGPIPTPSPTVSVKVGGVAAENVRVLSATSLTCLVGAADPGAYSVAVQNLDINGNPIGGELVTVANLVTFARADLALEADFTRVTRTLLRLLKQQVIENVVKTVESDYSSTPGAAIFDIPEIASLPCVVLSGPKTKSPLYEYVDTPENNRGNAFTRRRWTKTMDLVYSVSGFDDHEMRILNLQALIDQVLVVNTSLTVQRDPSDASKGTVAYEMEGSFFQQADAPNASNVRMFTGEITIRGFQLEDIIGFPDQMVRETGAQVDTIGVSEKAFVP